jgi:hypothetical protein
MTKRTESGRRATWAGRAGVTAAALCAAAALAAGAPGRHPRADVPRAFPAAAVPGQGASDDVQLTIRDTGIEPSHVTRAAGKFLLTADDRRGDRSQALRLRLSRENGEHLRDIEVPPIATDWAEELELGAGRYVLSELSHTDWSCAVVIE